MDAYELAPQKDGKWNVLKGGKSVSKGHESRADALRAAQDDRGDRREQLYDKDGEPVREDVERMGPEAILLLRPDGSVYGELEHAWSGSGEAQEVDLEAAGEEASA